MNEPHDKLPPGGPTPLLDALRLLLGEALSGVVPKVAEPLADHLAERLAIRLAEQLTAEIRRRGGR